MIRVIYAAGSTWRRLCICCSLIVCVYLREGSVCLCFFGWNHWQLGWWLSCSWDHVNVLLCIETRCISTAHHYCHLADGLACSGMAVEEQMFRDASWACASLCPQWLFRLQPCTINWHCNYVRGMRMIMSMIRVLHSVRMNWRGWEETGISNRRRACSSYIPISDLFAEFSGFELHFS